MKSLSFILIAVSLLSSCKQNIYNRVNAYVKKNCIEDTCVVKMSDLFKFDWDTMYVLDAIDGIPFKYEKYRVPLEERDPDISRRLVFVYNSKIVYLEQAALVSEPHPVSFLIDTLEFTPRTAIFSVTKHEYRDKTYYDLTNIREDK